MSAFALAQLAPAAKCPTRRTSAAPVSCPRGRASIRVMVQSRQTEATEAKLSQRLTGAVLAAAMAASVGLSTVQPAYAESAAEMRAAALEHRRELLAQAREKAESSASSLNNNGVAPPTEEPAVPEPAAPRESSTSKEDLKAMLSKYKTAPAPKAAPAAVEAPTPPAPKPDPAPAPPVYSFKAPEKPAEPPAPAARAKPAPAMPSFNFSMPEMAAPAPPTPPPASTPPAPAPQQVTPPNAPQPAPAKKVEAKKTDKKSKRKGPLPGFAAELLMGAMLAGVGLAGTKYSRETGEASAAAGKFLTKTLTQVENTLKSS
mmetsp:Transcript_19223/g.53587  ORF Transcript_19223/g.53587 Transcript_19223/m.53587 type:complete len:316 (+) Transcript_19223:172-1119(+)|eukprot:CAMPEP_0117688456 /NCGR_PEP_ID=MMETSP0804-20121206/23839_1 /TAXON_ID=1074897 /ORGANISM="Tetraselmis astigmatica, Strain CCMP880" /LENGTH=315 /DNA_ID=CAMNT_0005500909 /DNA_START=128 /DNA_END=1075 /DNA_ORIENTATION=-